MLLQPFRLARTTLADDDGIPVHGLRWVEAIARCNTMSADAGLTPAYDLTGARVAWDPSADGFRLPTEAEWEHACRAGSDAPVSAPLERCAWTAIDAVDGPQPVAGKEPNGLGLHDMLGNLWEWCWDYADPARYADYRSLRGGGWADRPFSVRAGVRRGTAPDATLEDVGVRVAQGAVADPGAAAAQGWSAAADRERAAIRGPLPIGWTPLRDLLA
ncbi:formylglycine-generating enzyme family protein [Agrococcus sp. Marseille-P2731]|uniref:formylglycine-generating enzyme family protein n=1 Tax=Agrococcus sp. Marseille-P2731 TaxID=1841862 RepID=UPI000A4DFF34|nr:SUMF1/EgtB/PvdO family nonheme iron enzyme [Agrococcus sp. Marseille-P2731]